MQGRQLEPVVRYLRGAVAQGDAAGVTDSQLLERFAVSRDQAAFAALVRRHGPLVLGVCRRVLGDWHAAEDAFQATFLILARKAASLTQPDLLAHWLHGVACRTAARARADAARRRAREACAVAPSSTDPDDGFLWRDLRPVLDEEIGRLPERHRVAVVLCYLEGQTNAEAARRLGCPRGTVATLLARARVRLRRRLTSRGLGLPVGLAALLAHQASGAIVPSALRDSTVTAAAVCAADPIQATGLLSARAVSLAQGGTMTALTKLKIVTAILFLVGLAGAGLAVYRAAADEPPSAPVAAGADALPPRAAPPPGRADSYRTANFLVQAPSQEIAELIGRAAERHRKELALLWLERELPAWREPCRVEVKVVVGKANGFSVLEWNENRLVRQSMKLEGPLDGLLADKLPHEVTHLVLADWAGRSLPRWFDEGAALLSESEAARAASNRLLRKVLRDGGEIPLRRLLPLRDYPKEVESFHLQSPSLTDFLIKEGGRRKLLAFVKQGEADGWGKAVQAHYKYRSVEQLEEAWRASVGQNQPKDPVATPNFPPRLGPLPVAVKKFRGRLPTGPTPEQALVALRADGRLRVSRTTTVYLPHTTVTGRGESVTSYRAVSSTIEEQYDCEEVRVYDSKGREVPTKDLGGLLKGETLVLVAVDGRPVDPLHLRLTRDGTLVFVLPLQTVAPPQVPPPPTAPALTGRPARP